MKVLKNLPRDIRKGENIELYVTVVIAISLAILSISGFSSQVFVTPLTLAILALLTFSLLGIQHRLEALNKEVINSSRPFLLKKLPDNIDQRISSSKEIWLIGMSFSRFSSTYYSLLRDRIGKGSRLYVLTLTPNSDASRLASYQVYRPINLVQYDNNILTSLHIFCELKREFPANVQVRTIEKIFALGFHGFDLSSQNGIIYIEHYAFKSEQGDIPKMVFKPSDDFWYDFFKQQIQLLWEHSKEWSSSSDDEN